MIRVNLISPRPISHGFQVLCKALDAPEATSFLPVESKPISPALLERLLGKSPLRLIVERSQLFEHVFLEKLECGHEVEIIQESAWGQGWLPITAKRRRCTKCKAAAEQANPISERDKLEARAAKIWALTIEQNKIRYGTLYNNFFDENGVRRTSDPIAIAGAVAKHSVPSPTSPKRPNQSVGRDVKKETA